VYAADILDAYRMAIKRDADLRAAWAGEQAAGEAKPQAMALFYPSLSLEAGLTRSYLNTNVSNAGAIRGARFSFTNRQLSLRLTQPVYHHDAFAQLRQADAETARAMAGYTDAEQDLMLRVAERYFGVLSAMDQLAFSRMEIRAIGKQLEDSMQRLDVGLAPETEVFEAQARFDLVTAREIEARNQLSVSFEALYELTGQPVSDIKQLGESMPLVSPVPDDIEKWVETALERNAELMAARYASQAAAAEVDRQRAGHYPTLDIVGSASRSESGGSRFGQASSSDDKAIGLELSMPVFEGGAVSSRTRQAQYLLEQSRAQLEGVRRTVIRRARESFLAVITSISRAKALKRAVSSNVKALEATEAGFAEGTRNIKDVLDMRQELVAARQGYAQARYDYLLALLGLKQAAGILAAADIEEINAQLAGDARRLLP
jgi:outer membrane protein